MTWVEGGVIVRPHGTAAPVLHDPCGPHNILDLPVTPTNPIKIAQRRIAPIQAAAYEKLVAIKICTVFQSFIVIDTFHFPYRSPRNERTPRSDESKGIKKKRRTRRRNLPDMGKGQEQPGPHAPQGGCPALATLSDADCVRPRRTCCPHAPGRSGGGPVQP